MPRYVYRDINGEVKPIEVSGRLPLRGTPPEATMGMQDLILHKYKELEESGKWQCAYASKSAIKRIHETARERDLAMTR